MTPHSQPSGRYPGGALCYTLPYERDDLPGVNGDVIKLTYEPYLPAGQRWSGRTELDQRECHDLTGEELRQVRTMYEIVEDPSE